jgi:hypothetical protein
MNTFVDFRTEYFIDKTNQYEALRENPSENHPTLSTPWPIVAKLTGAGFSITRAKLPSSRWNGRKPAAFDGLESGGDATLMNYAKSRHNVYSLL